MEQRFLGQLESTLKRIDHLTENFSIRLQLVQNISGMVILTTGRRKITSSRRYNPFIEKTVSNGKNNQIKEICIQR